MRKARIFRPYLFVAAAIAAAATFGFLLSDIAVEAQGAQPSRTATFAPEQASVNIPEDGAYFANDDFRFTVAHKYGVTLLQFSGDDEVFVLTVERAPVGAHILKYDTGDVALQVTGYGAVTLYTSSAPGGLPAARTGDGDPIRFPVPSLSMVRAQATRLGNLLQQVTSMDVTFDADWPNLEDSAERYLTLDAMRITTRALRGLCANRALDAALAAKVHGIYMVRGDKPAATIRNGVLTVAIAPQYGLRGRLSSLATARAIRAQI